jgi:diaminopimelate epimerase
MDSANRFTCTLTKHHALGNDFLVLDQGQFSLAQKSQEWDWSLLARTWCDRRTGIGADGLLLLEMVNSTHLAMKLFNADGGSAEMSGNGIRCLVQAAYLKLTSELSKQDLPQRFEVTTAAGLRVVDVVSSVDDSGLVPANVMLLSVDMGLVEDISAPDNWSDLGCHQDRPVRHVSLGNPHSVVGVDNVSDVDLAVLGAKVPNVNLEIVEPGPEINGVTMRVHERGAGLTLACGTGACAVADAALTWGLVPASSLDVIVHMPAGDATVTIDRATRRATLTGPATFVATMSIDLISR